MSVFILVFPLPSLEYSCNFTDQLLFLCVFLIMWLVTQEILLTTYNIHGIVLGLGVAYYTKQSPTFFRFTKQGKTANQRSEYVLDGRDHRSGKALEERGRRDWSRKPSPRCSGYQWPGRGAVACPRRSVDRAFRARGRCFFFW